MLFFFKPLGREMNFLVGEVEISIFGERFIGSRTNSLLLFCDTLETFFRLLCDILGHFFVLICWSRDVRQKKTVLINFVLINFVCLFTLQRVLKKKTSIKTTKLIRETLLIFPKIFDFDLLFNANIRFFRVRFAPVRKSRAKIYF